MPLHHIQNTITRCFAYVKCKPSPTHFICLCQMLLTLNKPSVNPLPAMVSLTTATLYPLLPPIKQMPFTSTISTCNQSSTQKSSIFHNKNPIALPTINTHQYPEIFSNQPLQPRSKSKEPRIPNFEIHHQTQIFPKKPSIKIITIYHAHARSPETLNPLAEASTS